MNVMLKRGLAVLVCLGLLATTGVASGTPCCTMTHLADRASVASPDCCDNPDCCRGEKRGPADATLSARTPEEPRAAFVTISPPPPGRTAGVVLLAFNLPAANKHPPPRGGRDTHLRISLFRI